MFVLRLKNFTEQEETHIAQERASEPFCTERKLKNFFRFWPQNHINIFPGLSDGKS